MKIITRKDVNHIWYDVERTEVNIELENGTFIVLECYDECAMYRNYDRAEWCLEHKAPFFIENNTVIVDWNNYVKVCKR